MFSETKPVENGKLNGHTNGSVPVSTAKGDAPSELESSPGKTKQAFLSLEPEEHGRARASIVEVFKRVSPQPKQTERSYVRCVDVESLFLVLDLGDGVLRDLCVHCHPVCVPRGHCRRQDRVSRKLG